jgi:lipoprotein signal peptidase
MKRTSNSMAMINTRLRTTVAPLVAVIFFFPLHPIFEHGRNDENSRFHDFRIFYTKNKGALLGVLELLRAQLLVGRRVLIMATLFVVLFAHSLHKTEK